MQADTQPLSAQMVTERSVPWDNVLMTADNAHSSACACDLLQSHPMRMPWVKLQRLPVLHCTAQNMGCGE